MSILNTMPNHNPNSILDHVGNTPLIKLSRMSPNPLVNIYAKLEGYNPTGSIKDRVAQYLVREAETSGAVKSKRTLIEASTGNTALSLALQCKVRGYKLKVVMLKMTAPGVAELLGAYGVDIIWCDPLVGMKGAIAKAKELAEKENWFNTNQFASKANYMAHYETTGPEIIRSLDKIDVFIAGIGTGGTLMGVGDVLKENNPKVRIIGVEPKLGDHLQGLRSLEEGYIPPLLDLNKLDGRFIVDTEAAFSSMHSLLDKEGLLVGVSSGATLNCAQIVAQRMDSGNIVIICADGGWRYLRNGPWEQEMKRRMERPDDTVWW